MTTLADWITSTRDHLLSGMNEEMNVVDSDIAIDDEEITMRYDASGIGINTDICIGLEVFHVWEVTGKRLTVTRKWKGQQREHSAGDVVYVSTTYSPYRIAAEINNELRALNSSGLYGIGVDVLTYSSSLGTTPFDPERAFRSPLQYRRMTENGFDDWPRIQGEFVRDLPPDIVDSPFAIRFNPGSVADGDSVAVIYKKDFTPLEDLTSDIMDSGIIDSMQDIPPLGAAIRIVLPREIRRNDPDAESQPRRMDEVPTGSVAQSANQLQKMYDRRVNFEKKALNENYALQKSRLKNAAIFLTGNRSTRC